MRNEHSITVIIPALNEAKSIANVLQDIPDWVDRVVVADNGSHDNTTDIAEEHGADVVREPRRGYGSACLKGMAALNSPDIVVFLDGDYSDHPEQMDRLVDPIIDNEADLVIGSRTLGECAPGALTPQARFGNQLACFLMRRFWGVRNTDLGPFRAIRYSVLTSLNMTDPDYGWTVEMQIKAALAGVPAIEAPVDYRKRVGRSKVSGTVRGVVGAGYKILSTIFLSAIDWHLRGQKRLAQHGLIIFTRYPEPGKTKTRLIPELGAEGAAQLQKEMTEHALQTTRCLPRIKKEIWYAGGSQSEMQHWLGKNHDYHPQIDGDLGARMAHAFRQAFEQGAQSATLAGIDSPGITPTIHTSAIAALQKSHIVLGPATDGGYYLIGMTRSAAQVALPAIFEGIDWGTKDVFEQTIERIHQRKLRVTSLAYLDDVDTPEDLPVRGLSPAPIDRPRISAIIPTLNEAKNLSRSLNALKHPDVEIIVADGGSDDATRSIAQELNAIVVQTPAGRAIQMNHGAAKAQADILLFVHADTLVPDNYVEEVIATLHDPNVACGAFQFFTGDKSISMRFMHWGANMRSQFFALPYGDQALFMTLKTFHAVNGYDDIPIMEDYLLVKKLRNQGRIALSPSRAVTSPRRWNRIGPWRTFWINQLTILAWNLGFSSDKIARFYRRSQSSPDA